MFTSRPSFPRTPISSSKAQRSFSATSRRSGVYRSSTGLRSPFTAGLNTSRNQSFNCSFQTTILEQTSQHSVEAYGISLPVLVTEAITSAERGIEISVRISESGWAWLVCGRMLFVWNYKQDQGTRNTMAYCRELTLPPSDLAHKADLVYILVGKESQMPAALAVSPEGIVRYWPSISHEGSSVETAADLQGQECFSLTNIQPLGCILATTTSSLVLISPFSADGQNTVICRTLRVPQGVLAGLGRRVSSFIFGAMPNQSSESKQLIKVLGKNCNDYEKNLFVLGGNSLQKWHITDNEPDKLIYDCDIDTYVKEGFLDALWAQDSTQVHQLKTWCMDMQLSSKGIMIFVAGMNTQISQQLFYAFGVLDTSGCEAPTTFSNFCVLKLTEYYTECDEEKLLGYRFLLPSPKSHLAYIYNAHSVHCVSVANAGEEPDTIDFSSHGNRILGAGTHNGLPLFFAHNCGIVALVSTQVPPPDTSCIMNKSLPVDTSVPQESVDIPKAGDYKAKLKSAMILFCKHDLAQSQNIVDEIMLQTTIPSSTGDSPLDSAVVAVSVDLIDDHPAADPRWMDSVPPRESFSSSVIIFHQLNDKMKAQEFFLNFLKTTGLWNKISTVRVNDAVVPTKFLLYEHAEKVVAAKAMRSLHAQYNSILDTAIRIVLKKRAVPLTDHLTHQDLFYREVSQVESLFPTLVEWEEKQLSTDITAQEILVLVGSVNAIFLGVLQEVCHFRQGKNFPSGEAGDCVSEFIPWTATAEATGLRSLIIKQHSITVEHAINLTSDVQSQGIFFQYLVDLADIVLDSHKSQLESISDKEKKYEALQAKYHQDRHNLIIPLLHAKQYERAAALAEKYCDFEILVELCEETDNQERQQRYMIQFADQGFSDFLFKWYLDKGKRGKLLSQPPSHQSELTKFLHGHEALSWLHYVNTNQYGLAQQTLKELALREQNYLSKKKTLLSLSKLASLASDASSDIKNVQIEALNVEEELVLHQETLPVAVLEAFGFDPDNMRVLSPQELIEMYISDENSSANQFDFKKALDLLNYIRRPSTDSDEVEALQLHIWCKAILRDSWDGMDTDDPVESIKNTIFFRIIELAYDQGVDMHDFLPPVDALLKCPELTSLSENPSFPFLIQAGYEHILKIL